MVIYLLVAPPYRQFIELIARIKGNAQTVLVTQQFQGNPKA